MTLLLLPSMSNETGGGERAKATTASPNKGPAHRPWLSLSMKALFVFLVNARPLNVPVYSKEKKKAGE